MEKQAFEPTGLIPRSIIRTVDRFVQQLLPGREKIALQEYRVSRYQILVSIKSLLTLILIPLIISSTIKGFIFTPLVEHFWNNSQSEIFLNEYQEKRAFSEMHDFSEKLFFESLLVEPKTIQVGLPEKNDFSTTHTTSSCHAPIAYKPSVCKPLFTPPEYGKKGHKQEAYAHGYNTPSYSSGVWQEDATSCSDCMHCAPSCPCSEGAWASQSATHAHTNLRFVNHARAPSCPCSEGAWTWQSEQEGALQADNMTSNYTLKLNEYERMPCSDYKPSVCIAWQNQVSKVNSLLPSSQSLLLNDALHNQNQTLFQMKSLELAKSYNKQSILAITNLLGDFLTFFTVSLLFQIMRPELIILKSFLTESVYSLSDTTKSFLLILGMDLLVGFHSPRGWELALEGFLRHIGLPENENFILLFVALFPVFLDTVFKYWIFRYLNKISPSTVVTYHSMIE